MWQRALLTPSQEWEAVVSGCHRRDSGYPVLALEIGAFDSISQMSNMMRTMP